MTTLRDYILDCRCPNCGTAMQQQKPQKRPWYVRASWWSVPLFLLCGFLAAIAGKWAEGAYFIAFATFAEVVDR